MKVALAQMTSGEDPDQNLAWLLDAMDQAQDADILFTPEVTNCVSVSRSTQARVLEHFEANGFIAAVARKAEALGLWVHLGSLALKSDDPGGRFVNRSVLLNDAGSVVSTYDKIHMFDVQLSDTESYHESAGFRAGGQAVLARGPGCQMGQSICYDVRFPHLYRCLAKAGAQVLCVPSAFSVPTGQAHWHVLLRARAIETGCYVVAAAQTGTHPGSQRKTFGHSLVVDPWGAVILDAGTEPGVYSAELDICAVETARRRVPSLRHDIPFADPNF